MKTHTNVLLRLIITPKHPWHGRSNTLYYTYNTIYNTPILDKLQRASVISFFQIKKNKMNFSSVGHREWCVRCEEKSMMIHVMIHCHMVHVTL